ncbi:MAG: oleate hydratase [Clostridiales bacterium]|nr:oleate hydratase [Clostridiales bacterium]
MKKKNMTKLLALGAALGAAAAAGAVAASKHKKRLRERTIAALPKGREIYMLSNSYPSLFCAVYLINDWGFSGESIHVLGKFPINNCGSGEEGFVCHDTSFICARDCQTLFDALDKIPSSDIEDISVKCEIENYNTAYPLSPTGRLYSPKEKYVKLSARDKKLILSLVRSKTCPGSALCEYFDASFFGTDFFDLLHSMFKIDRTAPLVQLKTLLDALFENDCAPGTCEDIIDTVYNHYEEIYLPMRAYLEKQGVDFQDNTVVTDVDFDDEDKNVKAVHIIDRNTVKTFYLNEGDVCFMTPMSVYDNMTTGDFNSPAPVCDEGAAELWKSICAKKAGFGSPFKVEENPTVAFTVTMKNDYLRSRIYDITLNSPGTLLTFKDSSWDISIVCPADKYFRFQTDETYVIRGEILRPYIEGDYVDKAAANASGAEILFELVSQLGIADEWVTIKDSIINVIPTLLPYGKSRLNLEPGALCQTLEGECKNLAVIGDFALCDGVGATLEYRAKSAKTAVHRVFGIDDAKTKKKRPVLFSMKVIRTLNKF